MTVLWFSEDVCRASLQCSHISQTMFPNFLSTLRSNEDWTYDSRSGTKTKLAQFATGAPHSHQAPNPILSQFGCWSLLVKMMEGVQDLFPAGGFNLVVWHSPHVDCARVQFPWVCLLVSWIHWLWGPTGFPWCGTATMWTVPAGTMDTLASMAYGTGSTAPMGGSRFDSYRPGQLSPWKRQHAGPSQASHCRPYYQA